MPEPPKIPRLLVLMVALLTCRQEITLFLEYRFRYLQVHASTIGYNLAVGKDVGVGMLGDRNTCIGRGSCTGIKGNDSDWWDVHLDRLSSGEFKAFCLLAKKWNRVIESGKDPYNNPPLYTPQEWRQLNKWANEQ